MTSFRCHLLLRQQDLWLPHYEVRQGKLETGLRDRIGCSRSMRSAETGVPRDRLSAPLRRLPCGRFDSERHPYRHLERMDIPQCGLEQGSRGIVEATREAEGALPFALPGFDGDDGSEFPNWHRVPSLIGVKPRFSDSRGIRVTSYTPKW